MSTLWRTCPSSGDYELSLGGLSFLALRRLGQHMLGPRKHKSCELLSAVTKLNIVPTQEVG